MLCQRGQGNTGQESPGGSARRVGGQAARILQVGRNHLMEKTGEMSHRMRDSELVFFMEKQQKGKYIHTYIRTYIGTKKDPRAPEI